eukprot:361321-Chlamydomonas_euryale.AAC.3
MLAVSHHVARKTARWQKCGVARMRARTWAQKQTRREVRRGATQTCACSLNMQACYDLATRAAKVLPPGRQTTETLAVCTLSVNGPSHSLPARKARWVNAWAAACSATLCSLSAYRTAARQSRQNSIAGVPSAGQSSPGPGKHGTPARGTPC